MGGGVGRGEGKGVREKKKNLLLFGRMLIKESYFLQKCSSYIHITKKIDDNQSALKTHFIGN